MKRIYNLAAVVLLLAAVICAASAGSSAYAAEYKTYYVSAQSGKDSNPGTLAKPFKTIQKALNIVKAGDTVYVRSGVYNELLTIKSSGKDDAKIKIQNYPNEKPVIDGTGKSAGETKGNVALLTISNKSNIVFSGFELRNLSTSSTATVHGISIRGCGTSIKIKSCRIHNIKTLNTSQKANAHGISIYGSNKDKPYSGIVFEGNEIYDCVLGQSESLSINGNVTDFKVINNKIHDNDNIGIDMTGYEGTGGSGENDRPRQGVCAGNVVYNITGVNNPTFLEACADGIYVDGGKNIIIERNIVTNCDIGIEAASRHSGKTTGNIIIRNNLITYCKGFGAVSFGGAGIWNGTAANIKVVNNTIYRCKTGVIIRRANSNTNVVCNNIIYECNDKIGGKIRDNNVFNNLTTNPYFVGPSKGNFRLKSYSPAINKGVKTDYGVFDMDLESRVAGGTVDIGCYEY